MCIFLQYTGTVYYDTETAVESHSFDTIEPQPKRKMSVYPDYGYIQLKSIW